MSTRKWILSGSIVLTLTILIVLITGFNQAASPEVDATSTLLTKTLNTSALSGPTFDPQSAAPSAAPRITATPSPSTTPTFLPPKPTQLTVELSSTPSEIPPATAALETVTGSQLSEPFELPAGLYRITLRTDGGFSVMQPVVEAGSCSEFPLFGSWSGPFEGSASYRSTGCRVRFEVIDANSTWSVEVALEVTVISPKFPISFSGEGPAASDMIELPAGEYVIHLSTDSPALVTPVIRDGLCLERPIILATSAGIYDASYLSTGCTLLFQISDAAARWILVIELKG